MQTLMGQMEGRRKRIDDIVAETMRKRIAKNRKKLIPIMKTIILCSKQNIVLRGRRDDSLHIANKAI